MTKSEQALLQRQMTEVWQLVGELEALSIRLREAADAALVALEGRAKNGQGR